jgi:hypothetical protein
MSPTEPRDQQGADDERERRNTNLFILVCAVLVVVAGIWLVDTMLDLRKRTECAEQGRTNCNPIRTQGREVW